MLHTHVEQGLFTLVTAGPICDRGPAGLILLRVQQARCGRARTGNDQSDSDTTKMNINTKIKKN